MHDAQHKSPMLKILVFNRNVIFILYHCWEGLLALIPQNVNNNVTMTTTPVCGTVNHRKVNTSHAQLVDKIWRL